MMLRTFNGVIRNTFAYVHVHQVSVVNFTPALMTVNIMLGFYIHQVGNRCL